MMYIILATILYFVMLTLHIRKYKKNEKLHLEKLTKINEDLNKNYFPKFKDYHNFFRIISYIFNHYKPYSITTYIYGENIKLEKPTVKFAYQLKGDIDNEIPIFTGEYNNIPISNSKLLTTAYYDKSTVIIDDISTLDKYDNDLYIELKNNDIKRLYLINLYPDKSCPSQILPFAFILLTYKEIRLDRVQLSEIIKKIRELNLSLINIIFSK